MMRRSLTVLMSAAAMVCLASSSVADTTWTGDGDGISWSDPANWGGTPPNGQRRVFINGVATVTIGASVDDTFTRFLMADGSDTDDVSVHMTGGNLDITGSDDVANFELGTIGRGSFRLSGGTVHVANRLRMAVDPPPATPEALLTVDGGDLIVDGRMFVGFGEGADATLDMISGSITASQFFAPDWINGRGRINMTGGTIMTGDLWLPTNLDAIGADGHFQLDGGVVHASDFRLNNAPLDGTEGTMDITMGKLILEGDLTSDPTLQGYISDGYLTGYGGSGSIVLTYVDGVGTEVTAIPEPAALLLMSLGAVFISRRSRRR